VEQTRVHADEAFPTLPELVMSSITAMYSNLAKLYSDLEPKMEGRAIGARILISPPRLGADVMFIAYQPGDSSGFPQERGCDSSWPDENEYATQDWPLARAVRRLVTPDFLLARAVVTNVNFFRAKNKAEWAKVPEAPRNKAEAFSLEQVRHLIKLLQPRAIVAIGFDAFKALRPTNSKTVEWRRGKDAPGRLVCKAQMDGRPVVGVPHLSGCRPGISRVERGVIAGHLKALLVEA
jgi:hypothetical protein